MTRTVYVDSSAIVKLLVREPQSKALETYLGGQPSRAVSRVATVEVQRAIGRMSGADASDDRSPSRGLRRTDPARVRRRRGRSGPRLQPATLRQLDAIHLASAMELQEDLVAVVTYDKRMREAASSLGLPTAAPS